MKTSTKDAAHGETSGCLDFLLEGPNGEKELIHFILMTPESFKEMLAREMSKAVVSQQDQNPLATNLDLMLSALSNDRFYRVRRIVAVQLAKADEAEAFAGADGTSTIITERNIKALKILNRELKKGRRNIGVFYGAGHLKDME